MEFLNIKTQAFLGVIGMDLGLFYYKMHKKSIDTDKFLAYLDALDFAFKSLPRKQRKNGYCLFMDQLSVHTCRRTRAYLEENQICYMYSPVGSPQYNSIEYMFSKLKKLVCRERLQDMFKKKPKSHRTYIRHAADEITKDEVNNYIKHVLKLFKIS